MTQLSTSALAAISVSQPYGFPSQEVRTGNIYYYVQNLAASELAKAMELEAELRIPHGPESLATQRGFLKLKENDIMFVRSSTAPASGEEDVAVCWVTGDSLYTRDEKEKFLAARDDCLGRKEDRTRQAPTLKPDGTFVGGTAFEHNKRANPVKANTRCYTIGNSFESPTKIMAPCADNAVRMRERLLKASAPLAMKSLCQGPLEVLNHIRINADLINTPALGHDENVTYTATQLNIAPAEARESGVNLSSALSDFGGEHRDVKDNAGYYTCMICVSDLPPAYDPGRFFILYPGVFVTLTAFATMHFSGLRIHGGTAPFASTVDPDEFESAVRFNIIHYPPNGQTMGNQRYALGGLPNNTTFFVPPEMTSGLPLEQEHRGWCPHATYLEDGRVISAQKSHVNFIVRALYCVILYFILQLPEEYGARVDLDTFFSAFSMLDDNNRRTRIQPWTSGPGYRYVNTNNDDDHTREVEDLDNNRFIDQESVRVPMRMMWERYYKHVACHIPYAACTHLRQTELSSDDVGVESTLKYRLGNAAEGRFRGGRPSRKGNPNKRPRVSDPKSDVEPRVGPSGHRKSHKGKLKSFNVPQRVPKLRNTEIVKEYAWVPNIIAYVNPENTRHTLEGCENDFPMGSEWDENMQYGEVTDGSGDDSDDSVTSQHEQSWLRFLSLFDHEALNREARDVSNAAFNLMAYENTATEQQALKTVQLMTTLITSMSMSTTSLANIVNGWTGLEALENIVFSTSLSLRKRHAGIMLINYAAWYWLDVFIVDKAKEILQDDQLPKESWLMSLVLDLDLYYSEAEASPMTLNAVEYGIDLPNTMYVLDSGYTRVPKKKDLRNQRILSTLVAILEDWLCYPADKSARQKAWFIHVVLSEFGPDMVYLDAVWKFYSDLRGRLFTDGTWRLDLFKAVKPIRNSMTLHALHDPTSQERRLVHDIARMVEGVYEGDRTNIAEPNGTTMFKDTMSLDYQLSASTNTQQHLRLKACLQLSPDKYLMFRELAPSRVRAKSSVGPFTPEVIRTTIGIFSALVWRGVTFGTGFSANGPMIFQSADDFYAVKVQFNEPEEYFCDKAAYGVSNPFRSTQLVHSYWKSLQGGIWEKYAASRMVPFLECWKFFLSGQKPPLFPQLGPLAAYLLTADLSYAGVTIPPTIDDIVTIIQDMNKGAVAALDCLRLITPRRQLKRGIGKCNKEECRKAFEFMASKIYSLVPSSLHSSLFVDFILVEHTLCKFSRSYRKNLFS